MWEIPNIQQSGFVRNGFHMCSWRVSERVRGKGGGRLGGGRWKVLQNDLHRVFGEVV